MERTLVTNDERIETQLRDIKYIAQQIKAAKRELKTNSPIWNLLDRAEARLMGLSMFTSLGRSKRES